MESKVPTILVYLSFGLLIVGTLMVHILKTRDTATVSARHIGTTGGLLAVTLFLTLSTSPIGGAAIAFAAVSAMACAIGGRLTPRRVDWSVVAAFFVAFCFAWTIAWWRRNADGLSISWREFLLLHGALVVAALVFSVGRGDSGVHRRTWWLVGGAFVAGAVLVLFSTGLYNQPWMLWLSWHHWGAYIGPTELACAGVPLFHDAPAQYGLGPTALLATACGGNHWLAMYVVISTSSLVYSLLMLDTARRVAGAGQTPAQIALIGLVMFVCLFVWTAYPPIVGSPVLTPSVSGLRFLPVAALIWLVVRWGESRLEGARLWRVHLLWLLGVLWSPETAVQVTAVWWPYFVWLKVSRVERRRVLSVLVTANAQLLAWLAAGCAAFVLIYRLGYGLWPSLETYFAYVLYPPGPLPAKPFGAVWFFGSMLVAGLAGLWLAGRLAMERRHANHVLVALLGAYGATSYFLGRSHDNNLLNICAFYALLLLAVRALPQVPRVRATTSAMLAALLVFPVLAGWTAWADMARHRDLFEFEPASVVSRFSYMQADGALANLTMAGANPPASMAADATRGMRDIETRYREPVTVLDPPLNLESSFAGRPWSAYHGPENYYYFPSDLRRRYLAAVAARLKRPGWLLVRRDYDAAAWLADYDAVYRRDQVVDFGTYYAIRYLPRQMTPGQSSDNLQSGPQGR